MPKFLKNTPTADVLMKSMRSMGYTFEAAIADIIDNSISSMANVIELKFPIDPSEIYIAICDNGFGMTSKELFDAMKYGSQLKKEHRDEFDLGRFGLGLKSASLSQCRKLTVISKKKGEISGFQWNLDTIEKNCEWDICKYNTNEIQKIKFSNWLNNYEHGTVVLWEDFDLIEKSTGSAYSELSKYKDTSAEYLSLIFHRYINSEKSQNVDIFVNNYKLNGLDPFLEKNIKTNIRRKIIIPIKDSYGKDQKITVQPYILPFQKDLTEIDKRLIGGIENYRTKQGFYIYRNKRLIIWGTWFGRSRGELTKHARIKVDIPNSLDDIWGIDIKKQSAKIPNIIKNQLTKAVDEAMDLAVKSQTYRGRIEKVDDNIDYIWDRIKHRNDSFFYKINRNSKIFDIVRNDINDETWNKLDMILDEIENAIPYQQIYIDKSQNKVFDEIDDDRTNDIESKANILISIALSFGENNRIEIIEKLFHSEPFNKHLNLKDKLLNEVK